MDPFFEILKIILPAALVFIAIFFTSKRFLENESYDFIMAVGDDKTDEDMFRALADRAITVKIGSGHTAAQYNLTSQGEVLHMLNQLIK